MKISDLTQVITGGTPSTKEKKYWENGDIPWLQSAVCKNGVVREYSKYITKDGYDNSSTKLMPPNTVLIALTGATVGKVALLPFEACANQSVTGILPNAKYLPKYMFYYLMSIRGEIMHDSYGDAQPHISQQYVKNIDVPICSLEEQQHIVTRIEELFSEIDSGVETLTNTEAKLELYKQAVLKDVFYNMQYEEHRLEDLCDFITKGTTPKKDKMSSNEGEIPFIKVYNLTFDNTLDFTIDPTFVDRETHTGFLARSIVYPGDVLMNIVGPPMGKVSIVPDTYPEWNINQAIARFRCHKELDNKYLAYFLGYGGTVEKMKKKAKATAGQFNLTLEICRDITIPLPYIETQKKTVFEIETKMSQCKYIENTVDLSLKKAEAMRQSILKDAFEGRLL